MSNEPKITITPLVCVTYRANSYVSELHFVGKTEEEARKKLQDYLDRKIVKIETVNEDNSSEETEISHSGRGVANTGKIWMISKEKKEKARVLPSDVEKYLAMGYVKGGPRTSFD